VDSTLLDETPFESALFPCCGCRMRVARNYYNKINNNAVAPAPSCSTSKAVLFFCLRSAVPLLLFLYIAVSSSSAVAVSFVELTGSTDSIRAVGGIMTSRNDSNGEKAASASSSAGAAFAGSPEDAAHSYTTNEEDRREAAKLQARLQQQQSQQQRRHSRRRSGSPVFERVPSVQIAEGRHKYVQIRATYFGGGGGDGDDEGEEQIFVTSRKGVHYHRNAAEPLIAQLQASGGYSDIAVAGGGRLSLDTAKRKIEIYGFSYSFGKADHGTSNVVAVEILG